MDKHSIHIGTSGWFYKHWRGTFYPIEIKAKDQFQYYFQHFKTVEINNTFYRLPEESTFINWKNKVPDDFLFVIKASRYITHMKKLKDTLESIIVHSVSMNFRGTNHPSKPPQILSTYDYMVRAENTREAIRMKYSKSGPNRALIG